MDIGTLSEEEKLIFQTNRFIDEAINNPEGDHLDPLLKSENPSYLNWNLRVNPNNSFRVLTHFAESFSGVSGEQINKVAKKLSEEISFEIETFYITNEFNQFEISVSNFIGLIYDYRLIEDLEREYEKHIKPLNLSSFFHPDIFFANPKTHLKTRILEQYAALEKELKFDVLSQKDQLYFFLTTNRWREIELMKVGKELKQNWINQFESKYHLLFSRVSYGSLLYYIPILEDKEKFKFNWKILPEVTVEFETRFETHVEPVEIKIPEKLNIVKSSLKYLLDNDFLITSLEEIDAFIASSFSNDKIHKNENIPSFNLKWNEGFESKNLILLFQLWIDDLKVENRSQFCRVVIKNMNLDIKQDTLYKYFSGKSKKPQNGFKLQIEKGVIISQARNPDNSRIGFLSIKQ